MLRNGHASIVCVSHLANEGHSLVDLSNLKCCMLKFKLILQFPYVVLARGGQGAYFGGQRGCPYSSHVPICCSHVPIYKFLCEHTTFMCSDFNVPTFPHAHNMFMATPLLTQWHIAHVSSPNVIVDPTINISSTCQGKARQPWLTLSFYSMYCLVWEAMGFCHANF